MRTIARLSALVILILWGTQVQAAAPIWVTKLCTKIPRTQEECAKAHEESKSSCLQVPVNEPLEIENFSGHTVYDIVVPQNGQKVPKKLDYDFSRINVLSIGMYLTPEDEANLPSVSHNRIVKRVGGNFLVVQMRLQRDKETGSIYLYFKPFAAVGSYTEEGSQEFAPLMEDSVRDVRGLGLFLKPGTPPSAEALRTFVAVNKDTLSRPGADGKPVRSPHYELLLVRARVGEGDQVEMHTFTTSATDGQPDQKWVHYMKPYATPTKPDDCGLKHTIYFTEYTVAKQSPSAKASRQIDIRSRASFALADLDAYVASQGMKGDAYDNLTEVLDAIIDGKVSPSESAPQTALKPLTQSGAADAVAPATGGGDNSSGENN